jgi:hypothetical protein
MDGTGVNGPNDRNGDAFGSSFAIGSDALDV